MRFIMQCVVRLSFCYTVSIIVNALYYMTVGMLSALGCHYVIILCAVMLIFCYTESIIMNVFILTVLSS